MKTSKRILAAVMVVLMLVTSAPLGGFPGFDWKSFAADESKKIITDTGDKITRAQWLHNLAVVFEMTVEDEVYPDNYFSDLEDTHEYYYDVLLNVNFGVVDVEAGGEVNPDGQVTRSFAAQTMNYCLGYQLESETYTFADSASCEYPADAQVAVNRGWFALSSGNFSPDKAVTDAEVKKMLDDAKAVLAEKVIDENYDSEYKFDASVIEIKNGTEVTKEENTLKIINSPKPLKAGDKFAAYLNGIPKIYLAKTVAVKDGITTVTVDPDFNGNNLFLSIDAQGVADASAFEITPEENTVMTVTEVPEETSSVFRLLRGTVKLKKVYKFEKEIDLGAGFSGKYTVEMENPKVEYSFNTNPVSARVVFDGDAEISFSGEFDAFKAVNRDSIYLGTIGAPGIGGIAIYLDLSFGGSLGVTTKGDLKFGFSYSKSGGFSVERNFKSKSFSIVAEASAKVGLSAKFGITDAPIVNGYVYAKIGGKATVKVNTYVDGKKPSECANFSAYLYLSVGFKISVNAIFISESFEKEYEIWNAENSPLKIARHYEDNKEVCTCARGGKIGYFTPWGSYYGGSGLWGGSGSTGYGRDGKPYVIYEYKLNDDNEATITSYKGNATALYIPSTLDGYKVVAIGDNVFKERKYIRSVTIPNTVKSIGKAVFYRCYSLSNVVIPDSVTTISAYAFENCSALRYISIPDSVTHIGTRAFAGTALTEMKLPKNLVYLGARVITGTDIRSITIPKTVTQLEENDGGYHGSFYESNIETLVFEAGLTKIPSRALHGARNLINVTIPETVTSISQYAFAECNILESISIPDSVTGIGTGAFKDSGLTEIKLPKNLTYLGSRVITGTAIKSITIPKTVTQLEENDGGFHGSFYESNIETLVFEAGLTKIPSRALHGARKLKNVTIPDSVTYISKYAFAECNILESISIPDTVTGIETGAFKDSGLTEIKLPKNLTYLGSRVITGTEIKSVTIPKNVTQLEENDGGYHGSFFDSNIETVVFENGIEKIPSRALHGAKKLKNVTIPDSVKKIEQYAFAECTGLEKITIPNTVTDIGRGAFSRCTSMKSFTIPASVKSLFDSVFAYSGLETMTVPDTVTYMEGKIFQGASALKSVTLPNTTKEIKSYMFEGCSSLDKIVLPSTVTVIYDHAFKGCASLKDVTFSSDINKIDSYVFENCDSLVKIAIPDTVTTLGEGVFYDCDALTTVTLGTGITSIPNRFFEHCDSLESVVLPYRTASIGGNAFKDSVKLTSVTIPRATEKIESNAFSYPDKLTIYGVSGTYAENFAKENNIKFVNKEVKATAVTVNKTDVTINKGQSEKLVLNITPADFTDEVSLRSNNEEIVTVAEDGTITANNAGTAIIKITVGGVSANCNVTVVQPVTSVNINKSSVTIEAHETYQLSASVRPDNANKKDIKWSSSAGDIASVDGNGLVTAHKKGEAVITAEALDGSGKTDTCKITVSNNGVIATNVSQLESAHDYAVNCTDYWAYTIKDAVSLNVTFDAQTNMEDGFDYLYIYDADGKEVGKYTGTSLAGKTITVNGNTVKIKLATDKAGTAWGFKVTDVKAASGGAEAPQQPTTQPSTQPTTKPSGGNSAESTTKPSEEPTTKPSGGSTEPTTKPSGGTTEPTTKPSAPETHKHTEVVVKAVAATYTKTGLTEGKKCSSCGEILVAQKKVARKKLKKVSGIKTKSVKLASGTKSTLTLSWSKVTGAEKYVIQQYVNKKWKTVATTKKTSYTVKKLKANKSYKFRVKAQAGKYYGSYSKTFTAKTVPLKPTLTVKAGKKQLTASWKKLANITGYEVQYSTSKKFTKKTTKTSKITKAKTTKKTIKSLKKGKKYYVRVRAYKTVNGKKVYSSYSTVKSVKIK